MNGYWANINMFVVGRLAFYHFFNKGLNIILSYDTQMLGVLKSSYIRKIIHPVIFV